MTAPLTPPSPPVAARRPSLLVKGGLRNLILVPAVKAPQHAGFWLLALFLFHSSSRLFEFYLEGYRLPLIIALGCFACLLITGQLFRGPASPIGLSLMLYSGFLVLSVPGSIWRGGSVGLLTGQWVKSFAAFVIAAGLVSSAQDTAKAIRVQAYAYLSAALYIIQFGVQEQGRLTAPLGVYSGANELGAAMVLGCVYWSFIVQSPRHSPLFRVLAFFAITPLLYVMIRTGSRAAIVALLVMLPFLFLFYSGQGRAAFLVMALVLGIGFVAATPIAVKSRLTTLFSPSAEVSSEEEVERAISASNSSRQRLQLLLASLRVTVQNPLFGVGVGNFEVAENEIAQATGRPRGAWHGTHNTYTQISSEAGIPALLAFLACLWLARKELLGIEMKHSARADIDSRTVAITAFALRMALYSTAVFICFEHIAYSASIPLFLGVVVGFSRAARASRG
jgi:O-antigen ligase